MVAAAIQAARKKQRELERQTKPCVQCGDMIPRGVGVAGKSLCDGCRRLNVKDSKRRVKKKAIENGTYTPYTHRKRARKFGAKYERITINKLMERDGDRCQVCRRKVRRTKKYSKRQATIGHIVAMANGGDHVWSNVQLECNECNWKKGTTTQGQLRLLN